MKNGISEVAHQKRKIHRVPSQRSDKHIECANVKLLRRHVVFPDYDFVLGGRTLDGYFVDFDGVFQGGGGGDLAHFVVDFDDAAVLV
jgi:hypothetical protein